MSSNKDTTANSQNNENTQTNYDETTIIEEYTLDENFQNEVEDELEDINEEDINSETNEQNNNKNMNEFVVDDVNDVDDPDDAEKSINENLERIKNLSKNKFVFNNEINDNSEIVQNNEDNSDIENNADDNDYDNQQENISDHNVDNNDVDNDNDYDNNNDVDNDNDYDNNNDVDNDNDYDNNNDESDEDNDNDVDNNYGAENVNHDSDYDESHIDNEDNNKGETSANGRKKRGLPKTMLANQQKYLEALERQQRMISSKKDKNKNQKNGKKNKNRAEEEIPKKSVVNTQPPGTRRVIVAGKVKYLPIKSENVNETTMSNKNITTKQEISKTNTKSTNTKSTKTFPQTKIFNAKTNTTSKPKETKQVRNNHENNDETIDIPIFKKENKQVMEQTKKIPNRSQNNVGVKNTKEIIPSKVLQAGSKTKQNTNNKINKTSENSNRLSKILDENDEMTEPTKKIPSSLAKKMQVHKTVMARHIPNTKKNKMSNSSGKKIPSKYAKQIENDVKKQTVKNVKNFSDLRRIKALQDINPDIDIDANKASIIELRKLRIEQRKKEQADLKKRAEANKRDSAIQDILRNDKMSKFAKAVAIKNLSVNSRNRRTVGRQKNAEN
ncbi:hypothetical protein QJ857_gp1156 [Tupanvirus soda lake]|uniref:Uncharacterized protein n=2 Tax=Tupanvirus TaxID=2094720 RepID=A0A6N1NTG0_9VIRU|nr:hypothetical protein QJ857_gp1156 [Tupanvirus soda lake]QKU34898.1 hypothetical protein [Tupanvirus soda lake]